MKIKNYIACLLLGATALSFTGCNSLDVTPESVITDANYWKTKDHFLAFNTGLHALMRKEGFNYFLLGEARSNYYNFDSPFGGEATQGYERFSYNTINRENVGISNFASLYLIINQVNLMIDNTEKTNLLDANEKGYYLGTAYGMRAYLYFHLLRSWGDVILHIEGTNGSNIDIFDLAKAASPAAEVMQQIKNDVAASENAFNENYKFTKNRQYWSLAATKMLKGEVYLWSGRQMNGGNSDYTTAKNALEDVKKADVALLDNFGAVFSTKRNKEIIFAFNSQAEEFSLWNGNYSGVMLPQSTYLNLYYDEQGESFEDYAPADLALGLIRMQMNYDTYQNVFVDADSRKRESLRAVFKKDADENLEYFAPYANKFKGVLQAGGSSASMLNDQPIYRYADCLLMLATAKAFLGEDPSEEINQVRRRAYGAEYFDANRATVAYPNDTDYDANHRYMGSDADPLEAILKERMREFLFEGKRWYDLRLFGAPYIFKYTTAQESRLLWPINEGALTNNPKLTQTPGY